MTEAIYVVPALPRIVVPVVGTDALFPVRRIYCVGRNYADHVKEMGADARQPPFFFQKPSDAIVGDGERSEEHTSELQSLMRISYAVFCLKKKKNTTHITQSHVHN